MTPSRLEPSALGSEVKYSTTEPLRSPRLECVIENYFSFFSAKAFAVATQNNRLNETVLLSTQNMFKSMVKKIITIFIYFYA